MIDLDRYQVIDLTRPFDRKVEGFDFRISRRLEENGWNARNLTFYSHSGTHMDAPLHFGVSDNGIGDYPVERFVGKALVVDVPIYHAQQLITVSAVRSIEEKLKPQDSLLIRTHWSEKFGSKAYRDELPRIGEDLAKWCVQHKVNMLGVEAPSVADVNNLREVTLIHEVLLGGQVIIIEGLCNLHLIDTDEVTLVALPLAISGSDGSPARVIALVEMSA